MPGRRHRNATWKASGLELWAYRCLGGFVPAEEKRSERKIWANGPLLGPLNTRCRIVLRTQKGTMILTTTPIGIKSLVKGEPTQTSREH